MKSMFDIEQLLVPNRPAGSPFVAQFSCPAATDTPTSQGPVLFVDYGRTALHILLPLFIPHFERSPKNSPNSPHPLAWPARYALVLSFCTRRVDIPPELRMPESGWE